jgi:hypothetical protein
MPKSWVYYPVIPPYEALLFYNALKRHIDSFDYYPVAYAKREEAGMRYRFVCIARPKSGLVQDTQFTGIEIYKPTTGMPYATCLHKLEFSHIWQ